MARPLMDVEPWITSWSLDRASQSRRFSASVLAGQVSNRVEQPYPGDHHQRSQAPMPDQRGHHVLAARLQVGEHGTRLPME